MDAYQTNKSMAELVKEGNHNFSPNAITILRESSKEAVSRGHSVVGTEHIVYAVCKSNNRAITWIASQCFPDVPTSEANLATSSGIMAWLNSRAGFQAIDESKSKVEPLYSNAFERAVQIALDIGRGPVRDGDTIIQNGITASEFLLAGIVCEGTSIGATALTRFSKGKVNSWSVLNAINVAPESVLSMLVTSNGTGPAAGMSNTGSWWRTEKVGDDQQGPSTTTSGGNGGAGGAGAAASWFPNCRVGEIPLRSYLPPTSNSNWLIPGHLLIGEFPSTSDALIMAKQVGIDTFVCLVGEVTTSRLMDEMYPRQCSDLVPTQLPNTQLTFIHFPIPDFQVVQPEPLVSLVEELKGLILRGRKVFVHCRGGHGRTGTVVIPLLGALYDEPFSAAQHFVEYSTNKYRRTDQGYTVEMPETRQQLELVHAVEAVLLKHHRRK